MFVKCALDARLCVGCGQDSGWHHAPRTRGPTRPSSSERMLRRVCTPDSLKVASLQPNRKSVYLVAHLLSETNIHLCNDDIVDLKFQVDV